MAKIDHIGIAVKSLAAAKAIYEKLGLTISPEETVEQEQVRLVSEEIKTGAGGHRYVFVHPSSAGGVLLELVQE